MAENPFTLTPEPRVTSRNTSETKYLPVASRHTGDNAVAQAV